MKAPALPPDETLRLDALRALSILDTPQEERFDRLARLAGTIFDCPIALVSLVDSDRQWFKACFGLDVRETARKVSFCGHAILDDEAFVVTDACDDERFADNPLVTGPPGIRFYAGQPLRAPGGQHVGTLCVADTRPRQPGETQLRALADLARLVENELAQIELLDALKARSLSEARVERYARELDAIFNLTPDGFIAFDEAGRRTYANEALLGLLGADMAACADLEQFERALAARSRPALRRPGARPGEAAQEPPELEIAGPSRRIVQRLDRVFSGKDGAPLGRVIFIGDVTHEREIDRMKTEFLSIAAHELRTPMASIHGFAELLLKRDYDAETRRDLLATIYRQSTNLTHLVNELLDIARIEARADSDFQVEAHRLEPLVRQAIDTAATPERMHRVELASAESSAKVFVDAEKFCQALVNVLTNALKYSPPSSPVRIDIRNGGEPGTPMLGVAVRDEGIGMTTEEQQRVFERFYRADPSGKTPGAGLGMSLVRDIVELLHGHVEIISAPKAGTTVTLWLPAEKPAQ